MTQTRALHYIIPVLAQVSGGCILPVKVCPSELPCALVIGEMHYNGHLLHPFANSSFTCKQQNSNYRHGQGLLVGPALEDAL